MARKQSPPSLTCAVFGRDDAVINPNGQHFVVDEPSLQAALLHVIKNDDGRMMGTITEVENRAVCTGWTAGKLYILVAQRAGD